MKNDRLLNILIIDDDQVDRMRLQRFLRESVALQPLTIGEAQDLASGLRAIEKTQYDCILLDYRLPDGDAMNLLRTLQTRDKPAPPVLIQTVLNDEETGVRAVEAGAQDYLVKGRFDCADLTRAIRYACERHKLLLEKQTLIGELHTALANVKTLQGLIPICMMCKKVRDDEGYWRRVEQYFSERSGSHFSHGLCPECFEKYEVFPEDEALPMSDTEFPRSQNLIPGREQQEYLQTILNHIQTGVMIIDAETHRLVEINPLGARLIGLPREEIIGQECHRFVCPAERGSCPITDLGKMVDNMERCLLRAGKGEIPIIKTVVPVTLKGRPCLLESFVDISDRKKMEEERRASQNALESKNQILSERDHRIRADLDIARRVHASMFPSRLPILAGYSFDFFFAPATEVGGDFFDFFPLPEKDGMGIFFGDISGHGVAGALLVSMLSVLVNQTLKVEPDILKAMWILNNRICTEFPDGFYVSGIFLHMHPSSGSVSFVNASPEPGLLVRAGGSCSPVQRGGRLLGLFSSDESRECDLCAGAVELAPGDALLLFTDGTVEARNPAGEFLRLKGTQALVEHPEKPPTMGLANSLAASIRKFCSSKPFDDDISILSIKKKGT